jgi:hypothetical protein
MELLRESLWSCAFPRLRTHGNLKETCDEANSHLIGRRGALYGDYAVVGVNEAR